MKDTKSIRWKMHSIALDISVGKARTDKDGGFAYRSIEDIYKALKPLLKKYKVGTEFVESINTNGFLECVFSAECLVTGESKQYRTIMRPVNEDVYDSFVTSFTFAKKSLLTTALMLDDGLKTGSDKGVMAEQKMEVSREEFLYMNVVEKINDGEVGAIKQAFEIIPESVKPTVWDRLSSDHKRLIQSLA